MQSVRSFLMLFCCIATWSCKSVLGADEFKSAKCTEGERRCSGNAVEQCQGGLWQAGAECQPGICVDGACVDRCQNVDKVDLLFNIDNSRGMVDAQRILAFAIPDLVKRLVNPRCVDEQGNAASPQPEGPFEMCPAGSRREFEPILDMHIGVTTSSIGGHGADSCPNVDTNSKECTPDPNTTNNDKGHLVDRADPCSGTMVPTFKNKRFLAWDPSNKYGGETDVDNGIVPALRDLVLGAGQIGCGYESQLESVYRFLVDPNPYETIQLTSIAFNTQATPEGTDAVLLQQRKDFLRPDSLLAVVMLSDEDDCSVIEGGLYYVIGTTLVGAMPWRMPRPRQECAKDPNDPCCKSCGEGRGNCPKDPTCTDPNDETALLSELEDKFNLRCWDQKRRFGIDFHYPTDRYVQAFTKVTVPDRDGNVVPNPIFSDLDPDDANAAIRTPNMVFFAGIVGVPWQDIARDKDDLAKGFKDAQEFNEPLDPSGINTWDVMLGNAAENKKPLDPLMIPTYEKRTGMNPITGDELVTSAMPLGNDINGHEWTIPNDELQYACIFPLLGTERDCTDPLLPACDCTASSNDNPLCAPNPNDDNKPTLQVRGKARPSLRQLQVLRDLGPQGIVTSLCPAQVDNPSGMDFGYRPAMNAIVDRLKTCLDKRTPPSP